jgi:16S rRNA (guanine527-N7)-methyltransferase
LWTQGFGQGVFRIYQDLLETWQKSLNLVGASTLDDSLNRHFRDSLQIIPLLPPTGTLGDMGSGAGFPGLVVALATLRHVHLVESDSRKARFLEEVIRATGAPATVHTTRLETYKGPPIDTWMARAFAPLDRLLTFASPHLTLQTRLVLFKGRTAAEDVANAGKKWDFQVEFHTSLTHPEGQIVVLTGVRKR